MLNQIYTGETPLNTNKNINDKENKMTDYTKLDQEVEALADAIWDVAFKVWEFAELGYQEFKSSAYESEALE